ncbi:gp53-like domain-containing protein [Enterobacter roggenkampii]|uniref:gp53-like domain-containing protein n=1 Tax=Enterobacter roggenkampii TaxID=1812935 RepID=UPI00215A662B|nr:hypothetical protein [Enterobacter roggenkampii]
MALILLAANNAQTVLAAGISSSATSMTVNTGTGALFPSPTPGVSFFKLTFVDAATGQISEIVHVTARSGDVMTIDRAQEGTTARSWSANDIAANMMTAGTLSYILGNFQPLDATLTALAALTTGSNKLPYFTGTDVASLTDLSSVGRDVIGKTSISDILTYLHLDRLDQDTTETRLWSPDKSSYVFVQNGVWGAYSINSPAGTVALQLSSGGTGAKDAAGARTNLGLGNSSTRNVGTVSGTVAAGDDSRITGAMQQNQNGNDIPDKAAFRSNIGLGSAATRAVGNGANQIPDMSYFSAALSINGWAKLPNGLIIQQGTSTAATPSSPDVLVKFPIPFPTGVLHISEHDSNGGLSMTLWQLNNITRTAFYAGALGGVTRGNTTIQALATSTSCNWFAIGY